MVIFKVKRSFREFLIPYKFLQPIKLPLPPTSPSPPSHTHLIFLHCTCFFHCILLFYFFFNSREAIAEAIIGVLLVFYLFCRHDFCYDHMTSHRLQICFLFIRSCNFNWIACVTSFSPLVELVFLFIRVIKFLVTRDLPYSQKWLPHSEIDFSLL